MENYEKKYKEALKWMQSLYSGLHGATKEEAEHYFPELKDEDERIRKAIKKALQVRCGGSRIISDEPVTLEEALAWLEKQGENKKLDADKVIEWLDKQACLGWLEDIEVEKVVEQFKKDFGL